MRGYDKFSDRFHKKAAPEGPTPKVPKAPKVPGSLDGLGGLGGAHLGGDFCLPPDVIAPQSLAGDVASQLSEDEPPYDQPCFARRGRVERQGSAFLHFCVTCGSWGAYGYGVTGDRPGRWYCLPHRPAKR
jgi:hypothetical protein